MIQPTASLDAPPARGLDVGERRFLHPGPLRWLRALGWGVLLFWIFMLIDAGVTLGSVKVQQLAGGPAALAFVVVACAAALGLYALLTRLCEARWPSELQLRPAVLELPAGLLIGAGMMALVVGGLVALGLYEVRGPHAAPAWTMLSVSVFSGVLEELIMRAILLRLLTRAFGLWPALIAQAALFGAMHLPNPNATVVSAVAIALEAGFMLAGFYLLTGRLWMSIGLHAAWNFTQGYVFGAAVSGIEVGQSLFVSAPKAGAPAALSGGPFGPEASVAAMVVGTAAAIVTLGLAWKQGRLRALPPTAPLQEPPQHP